MLDKRIILILIIVFVFMSMSAVSAIENTQNETYSMDNAQISNNNVQNLTNNIERDIGDNLDAKDVKSVTLTTKKLSTTYSSGRYFKVKAVDSQTKKPVSNLKITLKVYTGKKYKTITKTTDSNGIARYSASKLSIGKHKIIVNVKNPKIFSKAKVSSVKISKAKLTINAPKITNYYKQRGSYQITIKNKESKKVMKGIKVIVKVFTGKKYKKYSLKTNNGGVININTKSLEKGLHKVTVNVKSTSNIKSASAKSSIKIINSQQYIKIKVNGKVLNVKLVSNKATKSLVEKLKKGDITVNAKEYGGFEKVGNLGFSLSQTDTYIMTGAGDFVLYDGNQVSLFYNSNSWDYTKLGKVQNVNADELRNILGSGDVTLVISLK